MPQTEKKHPTWVNHGAGLVTVSYDRSFLRKDFSYNTFRELKLQGKKIDALFIDHVTLDLQECAKRRMVKAYPLTILATSCHVNTCS